MGSQPGRVMPGMRKRGKKLGREKKNGKEGSESGVGTMKKVSMCIGRAAQSDAGIFLLTW